MSRERLKKAAAICAAVVLVGWLEAGSLAPRPYVPFAGLTLVAHAGGGLPTAIYTNSREAFDASYRNGFCLIETDFRFARDGKLVLVHEWSDVYGTVSRLAMAISGSPTSTDFMAHAMRDHLTPLDLPTLLVWMAAHPSVSVITDTKDDNLRFLHALARDADASLKARFIVQIYSPNELAEAQRLGFDRIIFTLYKIRIADADVVAFARQQKLFAVTMPASRVTAGLVRSLAAVGTRVFAHTVDGADDAAVLAKAGVAGLYTDYLRPAEPCRQSAAARQ